MHILFVDENLKKIKTYKKILCKIPNCDFYNASLDDLMQVEKIDIIIIPSNSQCIINDNVIKSNETLNKKIKQSLKKSLFVDDANIKYISVGNNIIVQLNRKIKLIIVPIVNINTRENCANNIFLAYSSVLTYLCNIKNKKINVACLCFDLDNYDMSPEESAKQILFAHKIRDIID